MKKKAFMLTFLLFTIFSSHLVFADSNVSAAITWLKSNQTNDGYFGSGAWNEHWTASAALALYLYEGDSSAVANALSWLKPKLEDSSYWFWSESSWGEADIPASILYVFADTGHIPDISGNLDSINLSLLRYQNNFNITNSGTENQEIKILANNGGFSGWQIDFTPGCMDFSSSCNFSRVEDSVGTSFALLGLIASGYIPESNRTAAINYLFSLQNPDGSFNFTSNDKTSSALYALGPDLDSTTALSLLALNAAGFNSSNASISKGLNYLKNSSKNMFGNKNHTFATSLAALAFQTYGEKLYSALTLNYLKSLQNPDGSFGDSFRWYPNSISNALDTAWAVIAMQKTLPLCKCIFTNSSICTENNLININSNDIALNIFTNFSVSGVSAAIVHYDTTPPEVEDATGMISLNKYVDILVSPEISGNLSYALVKFYYTDEEISDPGLNESTLRVFHYDNGWVPFDYPNGGVNETENFVWANITHFSIFGIYGNTLITTTSTTTTINITNTTTSASTTTIAAASGGGGSGATTSAETTTTAGETTTVEETTPETVAEEQPTAEQQNQLDIITGFASLPAEQRVPIVLTVIFGVAAFAWKFVLPKYSAKNYSTKSHHRRG